VWRTGNDEIHTSVTKVPNISSSPNPNPNPKVGVKPSWSWKLLAFGHLPVISPDLAQTVTVTGKLNEVKMVEFAMGYRELSPTPILQHQAYFKYCNLMPNYVQETHQEMRYQTWR